MMKKEQYMLTLLIELAFASSALAATCPDGVCPEGCSCICNNNGQMTESTYGTSKSVWDYDKNGNKTSETYYFDDIADEQTRYTYDANGRMASETSYYGDENIKNDIASVQVRYTYDANSYMVSETLYFDDENIKHDIADDQYRMAYDANGNVISQTYYHGNENIKHDIAQEQYRWTYDANGNYVSTSQVNCNTEPCTSLPMPDTSLICVTGYVKGCVGDTVTLSDGSSVFMQGGDILRYISKASPDGSTTLYNEDGTIKGFKNKRTYTIDEANAVAKPTGNTVRIKYR